MSGLKREIAQERPFSSREEETLLNLLRTADFLDRVFQRTTREWGITGTQYNVLRILRGAQPDGLPCSAIGDRMITAEPDITRLLARLKALRLIRQQRDRQDRRVIVTQISDAGLDLLRKMDPVIKRMPGKLLGHLSESENREMIRLLELARQKCTRADSLACDGKRTSGRITCDKGAA